MKRILVALAALALAGCATHNEGVVCVVGNVTSGPHNSVKALYISKDVRFFVDQTAAKCAELTK